MSKERISHSVVSTRTSVDVCSCGRGAVCARRPAHPLRRPPVLVLATTGAIVEHSARIGGAVIGPQRDACGPRHGRRGGRVRGRGSRVPRSPGQRAADRRWRRGRDPRRAGGRDLHRRARTSVDGLSDLPRSGDEPDLGVGEVAGHRQAQQAPGVARCARARRSGPATRAARRSGATAGRGRAFRACRGRSWPSRLGCRCRATPRARTATSSARIRPASSHPRRLPGSAALRHCGQRLRIEPVQHGERGGGVQLAHLAVDGERQLDRAPAVQSVVDRRLQRARASPRRV